ncbi:MAG TPA: PepSY domain-containing protein [Gammaproteobacteria bacterium]|nr:PepSY domain-containing protein [Gammaproteobacteria bacterium]
MQDASAQSSLYRAVWRWHFYAGLCVLPFLLLLAVTGALYLFKPEIDHALYRDMIDVPARASSPAPISTSVLDVERALDGRVEQVTLPDRPDRSLRLLVRVASGGPRTAFADPYDGRFLGSTPAGGAMQLIRKVHSLQYFGFWASSLIEIAAGWGIVLIGTGVFLWWPRGQGSGVVTVAGSPRTRRFWRDLHSVTGVFSAAVILFLAVTGMPWSKFWGDHVQQWATAANLNMPAPPADVTPGWMLTEAMPGMNHAPHADNEVRATMPWAVDRAPVPQSRSGRTEDIGIDAAVARFEALGLRRPFNVQPPEGPRGAYVGSFTPDQVTRERTVYLGRDGEVLGDVGYRDYGVVAKAIEWGIQVHQGQEYGAANRYVMLAGCVAIVVLVLSGATMWWKRRPKGRLAAPPADRRSVWAVGAVIVVGGVIFPLVGMSLLMALACDWTWRRAIGRVR